MSEIERAGSSLYEMSWYVHTRSLLTGLRGLILSIIITTSSEVLCTVYIELYSCTSCAYLTLFNVLVVSG